MTVFKDTKLEAQAASKLAVDLAKGSKPSVPDTVQDPTTKKQVPSVLLVPQAITIANINDVVKAGGVTKAELCAGAYAAKCSANGIN